ncbi:hypothetical protein FRB96_003523 [Tulasnella sp. 330]|nr:hypothetical protein FRB96_003523 [Tulasnella sp. 330]
MSTCTHCMMNKLDCTFNEGAKKRSPPKPNPSTPVPGGCKVPRDLIYRFIEDLEERVHLLEKLIRRMLPALDVDKEVGPSFNQDTWVTVKNKSPPMQKIWPVTSEVSKDPSSLHVLPQVIRSSVAPKELGIRFASPGQRDVASESTTAREDLEPSDDDTNLKRNDGTTITEHLERRMEKLHLGDESEKTFMGKSSGVALVQAALALKDTIFISESGTGVPARCYTPGVSRPKFWKTSPWEMMATALPAVESLRFPPADLIRILIDRCFADVMNTMPVLHRPTFMKQYEEKRHRTELDFARLLLVVCAIGARTSSDHRVCLLSPGGEIEWNSAGWMYFAQVHQLAKPLIASPKLVDLQIMALSATYLEGSSSSSSAWLMNGFGVRLACDTGAHRFKVYAPAHTFENQMWKRVLSCLVQKDRELSVGLGRPMCINDEDIDTELPLEVDDDWWDETTKTWPSKLTFFVQQSKLMGILAHSEWEQEKVAELDSALNQWQDALPDHLRWDEHMDATFYQQAATLRITFYYVQITIHRPLLQLSSASKRALSLPSLAVCANAARSASRILEATVDMPASVLFVTTSLLSGVVLMISIWEARRNRLAVDVSRQISCVQTCMRYLRRWENRYHLSGRLYDILCTTASVGEVPLPASQHPSPSDATNHMQTSGTKRDRDDDSSESSNGSEPTLGADRTNEGTQYTPGLSERPIPTPITSYSASPAGLSQIPQPSTRLNDTNKGKSGVVQLNPALPESPAYQWPTQTGGYNTNPLPLPGSTWENFPISSSGLPALEMDFQGLPGYEAQAVDWQELLRSLADKEEDPLSWPPNIWNNAPAQCVL